MSVHTSHIHTSTQLLQPAHRWAWDRAIVSEHLHRPCGAVGEGEAEVCLDDAGLDDVAFDAAVLRRAQCRAWAQGSDVGGRCVHVGGVGEWCVGGTGGWVLVGSGRGLGHTRIGILAWSHTDRRECGCRYWLGCTAGCHCPGLLANDARTTFLAWAPSTAPFSLAPPMPCQRTGLPLVA
eukprot:366539-Chlamydomonas_euryale.AAC.1